MLHNKNTPPPLRLNKSKLLTLGISLTTAFLLIMTGVFAVSSNRPDSNATDFTAFADSSIAIYTADGMTDDTYSSGIIPTAEGAISSIESNIRVIANNAYGYELFIQTPNTGGNMIGANTDAVLTPMPGIIDNPIPFDTSSCNSWGFATPGESENFSEAFDDSYSAMFNINTTDTISNFASVPTSATPIHAFMSTTGIVPIIDETRPYYTAVCGTTDAVPDAYEAVVRWTAIAIDEPPLPPVVQNGDFIQNVTMDTCPLTRTWVVDARDNKTYWVRKIPASGAGGVDLCWMETNLAYAGGGNNQFGDAMTLTQNTSGGLGNAPAGYRVSNPPTGAPVFTTSPTPPTTGSGNATGANGAQYGYLYNWCAAMGGQSNACNNTSVTGFDRTVSICPSGWRLPVGNAANDANVNDFSALNNAINGGSTTSDAGLRTNWLGVYAGALLTAGTFSNVGSNGNYWSSTVSTATIARYLGFNSTSVNPASSGIKAYGLTVRCVQSEEPPIAQNGDLIQNVTIDTCPLTRTWVIDARDNKTYWIQKIPNSGAGGVDACWMQTNLAYAGGGTNTFGDIMTITQNTSGGLGNSPAGYRASNPPTGAPVFTTSPTPPTTGSGADTGANGAQYGFFYNWCAAMGGQTNACNNTETNQANLDTTVNICPFGWRLPVGNAANDASVNDFSALNNAVNSGSTSSDAGLRSNWLGVYAGYLSTAGNFSTVGSLGLYWSSTVGTATSARNLYSNSTDVDPANILNKANGLSVRCVQ